MDCFDECGVTFDHCSPHGLVICGMLMMEDQLQFESFIQQPGQEPFDEVVLVVVLSSVVESEHD